MLAVERRNLILDKLQNERKVVVSELSALFDVSEETIRRDLDKLDREGLAIKSYGGAVLKIADEALNPVRRPQFFGGGVDAVPASGDGNLAARLAQRPGQDEPNAPAAAGDNGPFSGNVKQAVHIASLIQSSPGAWAEPR